MYKLNETRCNYVINYIYFMHQSAKYKACNSLINITKYYRYLKKKMLNEKQLYTVNTLIENCNDLVFDSLELESRVLNRSLKSIEEGLYEVLKK